jgi:hypothetical protein
LPMSTSDTPAPRRTSGRARARLEACVTQRLVGGGERHVPCRNRRARSSGGGRLRKARWTLRGRQRRAAAPRPGQDATQPPCRWGVRDKMVRAGQNPSPICRSVAAVRAPAETAPMRRVTPLAAGVMAACLASHRRRSSPACPPRQAS